MGQVSWRAADELVDRVREAAEAHGWSVNRYLTNVLDAATDPDNAPTGTERLRERRAGKAAGRGTQVSDLVSEGRG